MNKLIAALAKQARLTPYFDAQAADIERFARLVALHCVDIVNSHSFDVDNQIVNSTCAIVAANINTAFNKE